MIIAAKYGGVNSAASLAQTVGGVIFNKHEEIVMARYVYINELAKRSNVLQ